MGFGVCLGTSQLPHRKGRECRARSETTSVLFVFAMNRIGKTMLG